MPTRSIVYRAMASFCAKRSPKFILVVIRQVTNGVLTFCDTQLAHQFIWHVQLAVPAKFFDERDNVDGPGRFGKVDHPKVNSTV
jgi:hypothetical protein